MNVPSCPFCGQQTRPLLRTLDRNRRLSRELFTYYRCVACGLIFLWPIPSDLGHYYQADYYSIPHSLNELARVAVDERYKLDLVHRFAQCGRLLEVGPSYGAFAYLAKQAGFVVEAIELDANCCRFLNEVVGVPALQSYTATDALERVGTYDVIALWHVLEHLPAPWQTLEAAAKKLNDGGVLVVATPNPQALQFRVLGRFWAHIDAPRHLELVPAPLLSRRMQSLGLEVALLTTGDEGTIRNNKFGWHGSLMNLATAPLTRYALRTAGRAISKVMSPLDQHGLLGSSYTIVFRKPTTPHLTVAEIV